MSGSRGRAFWNSGTRSSRKKFEKCVSDSNRQLKNALLWDLHRGRFVNLNCMFRRNDCHRMISFIHFNELQQNLSVPVRCFGYRRCLGLTVVR